MSQVAGFIFSYLPDQAGGVVHVDAVDAAGVPVSDRSMKYSWDFGDGTILPCGWNAAHPYDVAGTFNVALSVKSDSAAATVAAQTWTKLVTIKPDARPVVYAATPSDVLAAVASAGPIGVKILCSGNYIFAGKSQIDVSSKRNITIDGQGKTNFFLKLDGGVDLFHYGTNTSNPTANIMLRGIHFESLSTFEYDAHVFSNDWIGWIHGTGNSVIGCTFDYVGEGIQLDTTSRFAYVADCSTKDAWSVLNSVYWIQGQHIVFLRNKSFGSTWENVFRTADVGGKRMLVAFCEMTAPMKRDFPYKATYTLRTASDVYVSGCTSNDSWFGLEPRSAAVEVRNLVIENSTFNNSILTIKPATHGVKVRNNVFNMYCGGSCLWLIRTDVHGNTADGVEVTGNKFNMTTTRYACGGLPTRPGYGNYNVPLSTYNEHNNVYVNNVPQRSKPTPLV